MKMSLDYVIMLIEIITVERPWIVFDNNFCLFGIGEDENYDGLQHIQKDNG